MSGTSATVTPDALDVQSGSSAAYLASRNLEFMKHSVAAQSSTTPQGIQVTATPALADISDITAVAQNVSFGRQVTHILANDPGFGAEAPFQYVMTSTMAQQISASFSSSSNTSNYI